MVRAPRSAVVARERPALGAGLLVVLEERVEPVAGLLQRASFLVAPVASLLHNQNSELYVPSDVPQGCSSVCCEKRRSHRAFPRDEGF